MFFIGIFGIGKDKKELRNFPNIICPCCGRYAQASLVMEYSYFHLFFLPLFKFGKKYYVLPSCGCSVYEADAVYAPGPPCFCNGRRGACGSYRIEKLRLVRKICGILHFF